MLEDGFLSDEVNVKGLFCLMADGKNFAQNSCVSRYYGTFTYTILTMFDAWQLPLTR